MGCCNIKGLPGMNENSNKLAMGRELVDNSDDLYIDNHIKSFNKKNNIPRKSEQKEQPKKNEDNTDIDIYAVNNDENLMSNKDILYKTRSSNTRKSYNNLRNTKTSENISNTAIVKKAFKAKSFLYDESSHNTLKIKIKLEFLNLTYPYFFSFFNFEFFGDNQPEIVVELKETKKNFKTFKFTENSTNTIEKDNDRNFLNRSINEDNNCFSKMRRGSKNNFYVNTGNNNTPLNKTDKSGKNLKYSFEKSFFEAEYKLSNLKNSFICIYLYAKNTKNDFYTYLLGEAFLPIDFLLFNFEFFENILEIPLINKTENVLLGYLTADLNTSESNFKSQCEIDKETSKKYFENYFKLQCFCVDFFENLGIENSNFNFNFYMFNNIKIKINTYIKNYGETLQKKDIIKNLNNFLIEKDLNKTRDFITFNPEKSINDLNTNDENLYLDKISYLKYFCLLYLLNEYLVDLIILEQQKSSDKKQQKKPEFEFLHEKIILSPFLEIHQLEIDQDNEFDIMLLTNMFFTFISNLHKSNSISVESIYADCIFLLRDLGSLFSKAKIFLLRIYKENSKEYNKTNSSSFIFGYKDEIYYNLVLDIIYKYLFLVNSTIDLYVRSLKADYAKKGFQFKAGNRLENLKSNFENLFINSHSLFTSDIFICNSVMNIYLNLAKYGKLYSARYNLSKNECYLNFLTDENSKKVEWLAQSFSKFNISHIFFKSFIEISDIVTLNSPQYLKFNYIRNFNFKAIFQRFNIEAKGIESKKFIFWNIYLNFILNVVSSFYNDRFRMVDFYDFNYNDFVTHFTGLFTLISNYPYFKIFNHNEIAFDLENLMINRVSIDAIQGGLSPTNVSAFTTTTSGNFVGLNRRFLGTYYSLMLFSSIIDIFYEFVIRKFVFTILLQNHKKTLSSIMDKIFFVIFYYIDIFDDKHKNEIKISLFNLYSKIVKILYSFQFRYKLDLVGLFRQSFFNIFQKDFQEIKTMLFLDKILVKLNEYKADNKDILNLKEMIDKMVLKK